MAGHVNPGWAVQLPEHRGLWAPQVAPNLPGGHAMHADALPWEKVPGGQKLLGVMVVVLVGQE